MVKLNSTTFTFLEEKYQGKLVELGTGTCFATNPNFQQSTPCNTENPAKWLFVTPYKSTFNQLVEEVVVTVTS